MSLFLVESGIFSANTNLEEFQYFIEKWVLDENFASNFEKNQKVLSLIKDFYTGVKIFDSKFALINPKIWSKLKFCIESLIKNPNFIWDLIFKKRAKLNMKFFFGKQKH